MANEFQLLPNPDNVPGAVTSGYQRQNTNFFASITGLDSLSAEKTNDNLILPAGGMVEVNGSLFMLPVAVTLPLTPSKNQYLALLSESAGYLSCYLTDNKGSFDYTKNGYYDNDTGARVIDIYDNRHGIIPYAITGTQVVSISGKTTSTYAAEKGWYRYEIQGGTGGTGGTGAAGGQGYESGTGSRAYPGTYGGAGRVGSAASVLTGIFRIDSPVTLTIVSGGNGGNGGNGGAGSSYASGNYGTGGDGGNGGNGGNGAPSRIIGGNVNIISDTGIGGQGGNGGNGGGDHVAPGTYYSLGTAGQSGTTGTAGTGTGGGHVKIWKIA